MDTVEFRELGLTAIAIGDKDDRKVATSVLRTERETVAKDLDVHVVKFLYDTPNKVVKAIWIFVLLIGIVFCTYYITSQILWFQKNRTATKISIIHQDAYEYPSIILCPARNWNFEKAQRENLSHHAQIYALTIIRWPVYWPKLLATGNLSLGEQEFYEFAARKGFKTYADFFSWIGLDSEEFVTDDRRVRSKKFEKLFVAGPTYDDSMMNSRLCHRIDAKPYNPAGAIFEITYHISTKDGGYGSPNHFIAIKYDTRIMLQKEIIPLRENRVTAVRLTATKYIKIPSDKCIKQDQTPEGGTPGEPYVREYCLHRCYLEAVKTCTGCQMPSTDTLITRPRSGALPVCTWVTHPKVQMSCQTNGTTSDALETCRRGCKRPCEYTVLQRTDDQSLISDSAGEHDVKNITLTIDYRVDQGLLVYEEVPTFTFDTLVSEVGGQMGLWVGASVIFVFEMFFLCGQVISHKLQKPEERGVAV